MKQRLKVFTWHVRGNYLYYLSKADLDIYVPLDRNRGEGYIGRASMPFGSNVHEIPANEVRHANFDCIIFQSQKNYLIDQHILFSPDQHSIPKIFLEHDPPQISPSSTSHTVDDPDIPIVHVTHFNRLMWDNNSSPAYVVENGIIDPGVPYTGELEKGIVVIDDIASNGRRMGLDIVKEVRKQIPLDLVGTNSQNLGGLGEVPLSELPEFMAPYRFFFNPARYTSSGGSLCEAMMIGMPVVGVATTELPSLIKNGESGFIHNDVALLIEAMKQLLDDPQLAIQLGRGAKNAAASRFNITRFTKEWETFLQQIVTKRYPAKYFSSVLRNIS